MKPTILGVGDYAATSKIGESLKTFALGSCVALIIIDPISKCIAMDHIALPDSAICPERAKDRPGHFADTGVPALLQEMRKNDWNGESKQLIVKLVGGASIMDPNNTFNIGKRNVLSIKKILWRFNMGALVEDVGGQISRTVTVDTLTGKVVVTSPGKEGWEV